MFYSDVCVHNSEISDDDFKMFKMLCGNLVDLPTLSRMRSILQNPHE